MAQPDFYISIPAPPKISTFVRRYLYADSQRFSDTIMKPAPTGCCYMGHIFRGDIWSIIDGHIDRSQSGFHLSCQVDQRDFEIGYRGKIGHVMAELTPTAIYRLFGLPAASLNHLAVDWVGAFEESLAQSLIRRLSGAGTQDERISVLDSIFGKLAESALEEVPYIDQAIQMIEIEEGRVTISGLCDSLAVSERNFTRQFHKIVGISPKFFARAIQLRVVVGKLKSEDEKTLTELAHECGFYDQSHFIKTMRQFFEQGPREFLAGENDMFNVFIGKFENEIR